MKASSRALLVAMLLQVPALALAQTNDAAAPATDAPAGPAPEPIVPPQLKENASVSYPTQALGEHFYAQVIVSLVLEIAIDGSVRNASVQEPAGHGFDEAALAAARTLRFEPARRAGKALPARIRYLFTFDPPPPTLAGSVLDASTGAPLAGATLRLRAADGGTLSAHSAADGSWSMPEVAVGQAGKAQVSISAEHYLPQETELELTPGKASQILFRLSPQPAPKARAKRADLEVTVHGERLPPAVSSFTRAEVRQIPGAFGDPFRAIDALPGVTPIISGLPFFYVRGAPPGNVGYFLDGVRVPYLYHIAIGPSVVQPGMVERVDLYPGGYPASFGRFAGGIVSAETTAPRMDAHGEGNLRLFDAGAMAETGFAGGRGSVLVGGRYSYTAAVVSLLAPKIALDYRDYQARVSYDLTPRDRVSVFSFGAYDLLGQKQTGGLNVLFGTEFYRLNLRHEHSFDSGALRTDVTLGSDTTRLSAQRNALDRSLGIRSQLHHKVSDDLTLRVGLDAALDAYTADHATYSDPDSPAIRMFNASFPPRDDTALGGWLDLVYDVTPRFELTPGLRVDLFHSGTATAVGVDPRLAMRFKVSDSVRITHAYGLAHQPPSFIVPIPGLSPANLTGGLQTSLQTSTGVEVDITEGTTATMTGFYNVYLDMTDAIGSSINGTLSSSAENRSLGSGVGVELMIKRRLTKRLGGFLSYTLSRSERSLGNEHFPSTFDRTHVANGALAYDLGKNWRAGTRLSFYTGTPKNPLTRGLIAPLRSNTPDRNPAFYRLDLRLEKRWQLGHSTWLSFVAEMLNVTLNKETFADQQIGPISVPSIGLEGGF